MDGFSFVGQYPGSFFVSCSCMRSADCAAASTAASQELVRVGCGSPKSVAISVAIVDTIERSATLLSARAVAENVVRN